jgi:hypothetical protein
LATLVVLEAFSFVDLSGSNFLSFTILIVDPTFSLPIPVISKAFSFVFPTFSWAFSVISLIFCYIVPKKLVAFYLICSKIELAPESYSSWATSHWASSSLCGFSYDVPPRLKQHDPCLD